MNRTMTIAAIVLVAVVMGTSSVAIALQEAEAQVRRPIVGVPLSFSDGCDREVVGLDCVAVNLRNDNGAGDSLPEEICDSPPFLIPERAAEMMGVRGECSQPANGEI